MSNDLRVSVLIGWVGVSSGPLSILYMIYYDDDDDVVTAQGRGGVDNGPVNER